jgi:cytosine permease
MMTDPTGTTSIPPSPTAPVELERRSWQTSIAPKYIGLFLWVAYFDQLGGRALAIGGLGPSVLGAALAGLLCYALLYHAPAMWGFRTGKPLATLGTSAFGASGARWLTGVLVGLGQLVWFAVGIYYGTELTFEALVSFGLMDPRYLQPWQVGGWRLPNWLFLFTSLSWCYAAAMVGHYLVRIIGALMNIYPIFMALLLAAAVLLTLRDVPQFRPIGVDPATGEAARHPALLAMALMIELIFGFFAPAGALAADWGAVNRTARDVRLGGWVAVAFASWTVATLALLTVAGALGHAPGAPGLWGGPGLVGEHFSFHHAVRQAIGGKLAGVIFLVFGLGSLAPACFSIYVYSKRFEAAWPGVGRVRWTLLGASAAWLVIATGGAGRLETIFTLMGATFAPMVGALAADYLRRRGGWADARRGINTPGLVGWAVGLVVGLVPILGGKAGAWLQPSAVFAFLAALVTYLILATLGAEAPPLPEAEPDATTGAA